MNIFDENCKNYQTMLINEIYNKNIYNVLLNNTINLICETKCSIEQGVDKMKEQVTNETTTTNTDSYMNKTDSVFYKNGKL
jgi:hypothetical protein